MGMEQSDSPESPISPEKAVAYSYLLSLLNRSLRIHTTDTRMFRGDFKCTDPDCNIVLAHTYEYRHPSQTKLAEQAAEGSEAAATATVTMDMVSRYMGLVVVPGEHITKIEIEEFKSQMKQ